MSEKHGRKRPTMDNKERANLLCAMSWSDTQSMAEKITKALDEAGKRALKEFREGIIEVVIDRETPMQALPGLGLTIFHLNKKIN